MSIKKYSVLIVLIVSIFSIYTHAAGFIPKAVQLAELVSGVDGGFSLLERIGGGSSSAKPGARFGVLYLDQDARVKGRIDLSDAKFVHNEFYLIDTQAGFVFAIQRATLDSIVAKPGSKATLNSFLAKGMKAGAVFVKQNFEAGDLQLRGNSVHEGNKAVITGGG